MQLTVQFKQTNQKLPVAFKDNSKAFGAAFQNLQVVTERPDVEYYAGEYEVTPTVDGLTVPTAQKYLTDDLTVKAIPVYNVSNTSGGSTFYIATMDEEPDGGIAVLGKAKLGSMIL